MDDECEVVYVDGLAKMLGRTEASIRSGLSSNAYWLPKGFKLGGRLCWIKEDVRTFLRECRDGQHKPAKPGRKRSTPPTLAEIIALGR